MNWRKSLSSSPHSAVRSNSPSVKSLTIKKDNPTTPQPVPAVLVPSVFSNMLNYVDFCLSRCQRTRKPTACPQPQQPTLEFLCAFHFWTNKLFLRLSLLIISLCPFLSSLLHSWFIPYFLKCSGHIRVWYNSYGFSTSETRNNCPLSSLIVWSRKKMVLLNQHFTTGFHLISYALALLFPPVFFPPSVGAFWSYPVSLHVIFPS